MFAHTKDASPTAMASDVGSVLQRLAVFFLGFVALACTHAILYHLHYILAPFILSGFLVFGLEPWVKRIYKSLAGLSKPYRWCCCGMRRRWRSRHLSRGAAAWGNDDDSSEEDEENSEDEESQPLLADQAGADWEGYTIRVLDGTCRFLAVLIVMGGMLLVGALLLYLLFAGALQIKDNWKAYQNGAQHWAKWLDHMRDTVVARLQLSSGMDSRVRMVYTNLLARFQESIAQLVDMIVTYATGSVSFVVIVMLYMLFWLFLPLPIGGKASSLVQNYIWKKTVVSCLYGMSVAFLLFCLGVDLPTFFGLVSFCLYFVPEVGAFISMLAPVPLILLNGNIEHPFSCLLVALLGQVLLKLIIGNFLELKLVSADDEMSLHPVWVLLSLNYFGFLWGPVGMLISVPLLAAVKSIVISQERDLKNDQPFFANFAGGIVACLEGRKRHDVRRRSTWLLPFNAAAADKNALKDASATPTQAEAASESSAKAEEVAQEPSKLVVGSKRSQQS